MLVSERQRKMEDTKQRILEKSLELFSTKGYDAVSVGEIAKAVGIKAPSLYNHFPSKQAIFGAILETTSAASWSRWPSGYARAAMDGCGKPQPKTKRPLCRRIALRHSGFFATYGDDSDYIPCTIKLTRNSWIFLAVFFYCTNRQKQRRRLRTQQR